MIQIINLDHLVLTVKDINRAASFYERVLGMKKEIFGANRVALKFGNQKINLHQLGREFEPKATAPRPGSADLCFIIKFDLAKAMSYVEKQAIEIIEGPVARTGANGAIESFYFRDLDGNLIEISSYIA